MHLNRWLFLICFLGFLTAEAFGQGPAATGAAAAPLAIAAGGGGNFGKIIAKRVVGGAGVQARTISTGVSVPVVDDMQLTQGQEVTVGANCSVVLVFTNGASLSLEQNSDLNIDLFVQDQYAGTPNLNAMTDEPSVSNTKVTLKKGALVGKVAKLKTTAGSSFTVDTPVGSAGIRGTVFRIVYTPTGTGNAYNVQFTTAEGQVEVALSTGITNGPPQQVGGNQEITIVADVTTNAAGVITITLPPATAGAAPQTVTVQPATTVSLTTVNTVATQIAAVALATVLPTATVTVTPPPTLNVTLDTAAAITLATAVTPPAVVPPPEPPAPTPPAPPIIPPASRTTPSDGL